MPRQTIQTEYQDRQGRLFDLQISPLQYEGPFNDLALMVVKVTQRSAGDVTHIFVDISEDLLRYQIRNDANKKRVDEDILTELTQVVSWIEIEKGLPSRRIERKFRTDNSPRTYELTLKQLDSEWAWSKAILIQDVNDRKFVVFKDKKYYIPDSVTRNALGYRLDRFTPVSESELAKYPTGDNIESVSSVTLIRDVSKHAPVFARFTTPVDEKRHIPNPPTLDAMGRKQEEVTSVDHDVFTSIPTGTEIKTKECWDIQPQPKPVTQIPIPAANVQIIHGNVGQASTGTVNHPVLHLAKENTESRRWFQGTWFNFVMVLAAVSTIVLVFWTIWPGHH